MDIQAEILIEVIVLLTAACAAAWALLAGPLRIAPKACRQYAVANGLLMLGLILNALRTEGASYITWFGADLSLIAGIIMMRFGTVFLFRLPINYKPELLLLAVVIFAMLMVPPSVESQHYLGIVFSLAAALLFVRLGESTYKGLLPSVGHNITLLLVMPLILAAVLFLVRLGLIMTQEDAEARFISIHTAEAVPMLWFYLVLSLSINVVAMGNALTRLVQKIRVLADRDMLTGLWNRRSAELRLRELNLRWQKGREPFAIVLLDLDHFKKINDKLGHQAGDAALRQAALILSHSLRETDMLCRFGGEEFLVILSGVGIKQAHLVAEKLRESLAATALRWDDDEVVLSASFGCAAMVDGMSVSQLISAADHAMYQAKAGGRNCVMDSAAGPLQV
ncbi:GGDEF domain-containing protein [Shewanella amazonensis]|uniref:diguanylate cyclase n=1 Tax=Shewanella amazonensis (strain ATCC BAA-1098 / SB2B) TaxID=326297 RepID=A1SBI3_SHEAM|nr:GGDEF domain-containing protein [Shewanella amazonensis]ABM01740.1 diguanylate cyclase [Shewanella amazonensis SB2B]